MLDEGPGDGGLEGHTQKNSNEASIGHVIGSPDAPTTMGLIQSSLGALPREAGCSVTISLSHVSLFVPYKEPLLILTLLFSTHQLVVIIGYEGVPKKGIHL